MRALLRYQFAVLFRSHRWVFPLVTFVLLISVGGVGQAQPLSTGLDWAAAILVPVVALALIAAGYEMVTSGGLRLLHSHPGLVLSSLAAGLGKALICIFVGSAVGALCNRPVIRHQTVALLSTIAAVVVGLLSSVSPANAALSGNGAAVQSAAWPVGVPFLAAASLVVLAWVLSAWLAARRSG
jgi:hypothetical protein